MTMSKVSADRLKKAHPLLQKLFTAVAAETDIVILDSTRGKAAQELAYKKGNTKVHFGNSAHNYTPAIALDVCPLPVDWSRSGRKKFEALGKQFVLPIAARLKISIRWGADWNMNSVLTDEKFSDMPHYELHPWRTYAKQSKLVEE